MKSGDTTIVPWVQQTARPCSPVLGKELDGVWQAWPSKLRAAKDVVHLFISAAVFVFSARLDRRRWDDWQEKPKLRTIAAPKEGPTKLCDGQYLDDQEAHGIESLEDGAQDRCRDNTATNAFEPEHFARQEMERVERGRRQARHYLRSPKCGMAFQAVTPQGGKADRCHLCNGTWLDEG